LGETKQTLTHSNEDGKELGRPCVKEQLCMKTVMVFQEGNGKKEEEEEEDLIRPLLKA